MTRKAHKVDRELTASKHFLDKRSYCTLKGETFIFGKDWEVMRDAVLMRDNFRCLTCGLWDYVDRLEVHHHRHRGKGGDDSRSNLRTICRTCHSREHVGVQWSKKT